MVAEAVHEPQAQISAALALWRITGNALAILPTLSDGIKHADGVIRHHAIWALGQLGTKAGPAVPELIGLLAHGDPLTRLATAATLTNIGVRAAGIPMASRPDDALVRRMLRSIREAQVA
ncbi:MAG: HEAT repeat domain-containing protein [Gemmataceae bacterium]|nr:HEAT repeat domain-containing protein [Gemmataceae bacterium]